MRIEQDQRVDETNYSTKLENIENGKLFLKSTLNSRLYYFLEDYVEVTSPPPPRFTYKIFMLPLQCKIR